jgi:hypothetical protein
VRARIGRAQAAAAPVALPAFAVAVAVAFSGCGGVKASDLFLVTRTGSSPPSKLTLVVNEEGGVTCNGRTAARKISDSQLVLAGGIKEELHDAASEGLYLSPRPGSVYSYMLRDENGAVRFSDNSAHATKPMHELVLLVLQIAQQVCNVS